MNCSIPACQRKYYAKTFCFYHWRKNRENNNVPVASPLYNSWQNMKQRTINPKHHEYVNYGLRGIKVCSVWKNDFRAFYEWAMNNGYKKGLTIDRINVNGDYEPSNCRWLSMADQQMNKRTTVYVEYKNKTKTLKQWALDVGIPYTILNQRRFAKWSVERMLTTPRRLY